MAGKTGRASEQFMLRLPAGMKEQIKDAADAVGRSMNAEIVARLEDSLEVDEAGGKQAFLVGQLAGSIEGGMAVFQSRLADVSEALKGLTAENRVLREEMSALREEAAERSRSKGGT